MEVIGTVPVTPSARIGGLIVLTVACVAGAEAPVGAQPGHTGWTVSLVAGSLFGGDLGRGSGSRPTAAPSAWVWATASRWRPRWL